MHELNALHAFIVWVIGIHTVCGQLVDMHKLQTLCTASNTIHQLHAYILSMHQVIACINSFNRLYRVHAPMNACTMYISELRVCSGYAYIHQQ